VTAFLVAGALVGLGLFLVVRGLVPVRQPLAAALGRLRAPAPPAPPGLGERLGSRLVLALERAGLEWSGTRSDLAVTGRSLEAHGAKKLVSALAAGAMVPAMAALMTAGGLAVPLSLPVAGAVVGALCGFLLPDVLVHLEASERRVELRRALSAFLDLAVVVLAGGGGIETALYRASRTGSGWAPARIRGALEAAQATRLSPWSALERLGTELSVPELCELAASVSLAGTEGARVRASLVAKAASMRTHELAEAESKANRATEAMSAPVALLAIGFVVFLGFPAVMGVLALSS
jgi:Flp pilus assembly protein TadB